MRQHQPDAAQERRHLAEAAAEGGMRTEDGAGVSGAEAGAGGSMRANSGAEGKQMEPGASGGLRIGTDVQRERLEHGAEESACADGRSSGCADIELGDEEEEDQEEVEGQLRRSGRRQIKRQARRKRVLYPWEDDAFGTIMQWLYSRIESTR